MLTALRRSLGRLLSRADQAVATVGHAERKVERWPYEEWHTVRRALDALRERGIEVYLRCDAPGCQKYVMTHHRGPDGMILRCRHKDRVLVRTRKSA